MARRHKQNRKPAVVSNSPAANTFDQAALKRICEMHEDAFEDAFDLDRYSVEQPVPDDFYLFRDNGSKILAVAHLDTVGEHRDRGATFSQTAAGLVVHSRALDDRLGASIILDQLPKLGINVDVLLTVGEESGRSTASFFEPVKQYDWMIEFDRGGTDVVMYQYDDAATRDLVKMSGARVGDGIFSDICYLDHLGVKGFNWGVGYEDYHGPRAHAYLEDTFEMLDYFVDFHAMQEGVRLRHDDMLKGDVLDERDPFYYSDGFSSSRYGRPMMDDDERMDLHSWLMRNA